LSLLQRDGNYVHIKQRLTDALYGVVDKFLDAFGDPRQLVSPENCRGKPLGRRLIFQQNIHRPTAAITPTGGLDLGPPTGSHQRHQPIASPGIFTFTRHLFTLDPISFSFKYLIFLVRRPQGCHFGSFDLWFAITSWAFFRK
jgi:hypothetical protein